MPHLDYKLVRETAQVSSLWHREHGDAAVDTLMEETRTRALKVAAQIGIGKPVVETRWGLHVICGFTDYPMYLCGEKAPQIRTHKDVFHHVWHLDNPVAEYTVTVRDQDEDDERDRRWMAEMVEKARGLIAKHGRREGLELFQEDGNWQSNVMRRVKEGLSRLRTAS